MNYFDTSDEINGLNPSKKDLSNPYIINVSNNSPQDKLVTIFDANAQLQELNNTLLDGILWYIGNTFINNLVFLAEINGKKSFKINGATALDLIVWNGVDAWELLDSSHPMPNIILKLFKDTALPIGGIGEWTVVTPSAFDNFNTKREVQPTSSIPGVTYPQILQQSTAEPFVVGKTQIYSSNVNQLLEAFTRTEKDVNGNVTKFPFVPTIDPYQNISSTLEFFDDYMIDGNVGLQFIAKANTSIKFVIYPIMISKLQNELEGNKEVENYEIEKEELEKRIVLENKYSNFSKPTKNNKINLYPTLIVSGIIAGLIYILRKWD
jgi:hypothetical protein